MRLLLVSLHEKRRTELATALGEHDWTVRVAPAYTPAITMLAEPPVPEVVLFDVMSPRPHDVDRTTPAAFHHHLRQVVGRRCMGVVYLVAPPWPHGTLGPRASALGPALPKPPDITTLHQRLLQAAIPARAYLADGIILNTATGLLQNGRDAVRLTRTEQRLLHHLSTEANNIVTTADLIHSVWGYHPTMADSGLVRTHMANLRKKLRAVGWAEALVTLRNRGYVLLGRVTLRHEPDLGPPPVAACPSFDFAECLVAELERLADTTLKG